MKVTIDLRYGPHAREDVTAADLEHNIAALERAVSGKQRASDGAALLDTVSILRAIQRELPTGRLPMVIP